MGDAQVRKDSVRCVEYFLGASPEYFRPECPDKAGYFEQEKLDDWVDLNLKWLQKKHGDNLIKATVHLDEATPHIVAYVVPIHDDSWCGGRKKLSYNVDFGGSKHRLSELQDEYAKGMKPLKLERGVRGSSADPRDIRDYYTEVNGTVEQLHQREKDRQDWGQAVVDLADSRNRLSK
ncbi:MAG TPA: MobV family relaxase [Coleofasciculaceae cyanobacterium]